MTKIIILFQDGTYESRLEKWHPANAPAIYEVIRREPIPDLNDPGSSLWATKTRLNKITTDYYNGIVLYEEIK